MRKLFLLTLFFASLNTKADIVYDPWNYVQNCMTAAQTASILSQQIQQVQIELANLKNYSADPTWQSTLAQQIAELTTIVQQGTQLSNSMQTSAAQFQQHYPGYQATQDYQQQYQSWSNNTMSTFQSTLQNTGLQMNNLQSEQGTLQALQNLNNSPQGRLQALQVGNNLAAMATNQMLQLRQLISNQVNAENAYSSYQVQKDQTAEASTSAFITAGDTDWPGYRNQGFSAANFPQPNQSP